MPKHRLKIDFPNERIIESQIQKIISKGIKPKESFYGYVKNMYQRIGLRYIFHDATEIAFTFFIVAFILVRLTMGIAMETGVPDESIYSFIFIISPLLYLSMALVSFVNTRLNDTYDLEMTCKYNIYQLAAFRMLIFSITSIIANTLMIYFVTIIYRQMDFFTALMISTTSLFTFSTILLYGMQKRNIPIIRYFIVGGWILANLLLIIYSKKFYNMLLSHIPIYVYLVVAIGCIYTYIKNLKKLIFSSDLGGMI
ncbi:hypothetical protein NSA47_09145 [Irregularibacter muris]|uniref:Uncharacterized protein n=1 Tax=Irregularibacter muris TaxID=1796619 RepID=A0AAE3L3Z7_9FIRM|nr:hypothetical protein [Irregularibacter muris]MCR1899148.1 hypothetical protein [Irregularibacter muris]